MILTLRSNVLIRYSTEGGYAATTAIPLQGLLASVASALLSWVAAQLSDGESLNDVVIEQTGQVATAYAAHALPDGSSTQVPSSFRKTLSASCTVTAPLGVRAFVVTSEQLPDPLRDGLLAAWESIAAADIL